MITKKIVFLILAAFMSLFVLQGKAFYETECSITVMDEDEVILQKTYKIDTFVAIRTKVFNKGNYTKLYEKLLDKQEENPLAVLNEELAIDINSLPDKYNRDYQNATVRYLNDGKFVYTKEIQGEIIDESKLIRDVFGAIGGDGKVYFAKDYIYPEITMTELKSATVQIAEFSTSCNTSSSARKHNIGLACQKIESNKISSNDYFSFNKVVGARTEARGFQTAKIIIDGDFVDGVGGGVCQVSTTLFNAWCLAGLKVARSATHSLPVSYVSPSLDAMVSSGSDLQLYNDSAYPIYIDSEFDGNTITFKLYGKPSGSIIKLRSEVLEQLTSDEYTEDTVEITDWKEGETFRITKQPKNGLVSVAYRDFYNENGKLFFSERLRKTVYRAQKGKIVYKT